MTVRSARAVGALSAIVFVVYLGLQLGSTCSARTQTGAVGLVDVGPAQQEPAGPSVSPAGRRIVPGTRDWLGYVLPLDVIREQPRREPGTPPPTGPPDAREPTRGKATQFDEVRLNAADGHTQNETTIAAHADTLVAGWNNYTATTLLMGVARTTDGGVSWTSDVIGGHDAMSDPAVKAGGNGTWYYAYIARGAPWGSDFDVFVRRSTDAGATWQSPVPVTSDNDFDDKPYIDASGNEVLVGYADFAFSPSKVRAVRSTDGGLNFGSHVIVSVGSIAGNVACPVIGPSGDYFMFWRDSWQDSLWISVSTDQGATWSPDRGIVAMNPLPSTLPGGFRIINGPSADANPITGDLVVVWNDQLFGNPDILSVRSTNGGLTWSAPVRVNDDAGSAAQWFPWVTIDESGIVHVVWYDRRVDGSSVDVYTTRSLDGGATFEPNARVTAQGFAHVAPWDVALNFMGDYNGIAATAGYAYPCYQDAREGNQDVYVSRIPVGPVGVAGADAGSVHGSAQRAAVRVLASPTPFHGSTSIRAENATPGSTIEVVNVEGRLVRALALGAGPSVLWDGRDDRGRPASSGVYFARLRGMAARPARLVKVE